METNFNKKGRGRPKKKADYVKNRICAIRVSDEEYYALEDIAYEDGISISDLLREGIRQYKRSREYKR